MTKENVLGQSDAPNDLQPHSSAMKMNENVNLIYADANYHALNIYFGSLLVYQRANNHIVGMV